ncbi:MAG: hypothetical protein CM1200mP30_28860 [Pseudomonadota bacterium]|nr:MAG: hypothetical protein CM1200mP30_28860 [Pseudomonadota bacterium]
MIASFAAYAFAWMKFPGRKFLFVTVVGLLVVPLQMSLIPLLSIYKKLVIISVFGEIISGNLVCPYRFGLPLAFYLLRNYIGSLPSEIIESARMEVQPYANFFTYSFPLSVPALASFCIFQFFWVWNDLL